MVDCWRNVHFSADLQYPSSASLGVTCDKLVEHFAGGFSELSVFIPSFPSFSLPGVLWDPTDFIWGTPFEAMIDHTAFIRWSPSWGFLGFSSVVRQMPGDLCTASVSLSLANKRDTLSKWPLARNPDRNWWHRLTSLTLQMLIFLTC
jgi:hypothetical protein